MSSTAPFIRSKLLEQSILPAPLLSLVEPQTEMSSDSGTERFVRPFVPLHVHISSRENGVTRN